MVVCPNCGEENPDRARFCLSCAAPLRGAPAHGEERKVVSVLFVDIVGFTASSDRADPEDVRAQLRPYHARVKQQIERFGGTVEKFVGDAVMAVFGAPIAHEDDAERAVRAGLAVLDAAELDVRAAIGTGEAVVTLDARPEAGEGIVSGDVVNTASRLQALAPVSRLVVDEGTYQTTKGVIAYEELAPVEVNGKEGHVRLWLATTIREAEREPAATPFLGRDDEVTLLRQAYARAVREPSVQLVTVTGEPGVGKSRLIAEFGASLDEQGHTWLQGRCLPYGEGITFWALGEMVKAHAGILESDTPHQAKEKLADAVEAVVGEMTERDWFRTRLAPLVGVGAADPVQRAEQTESFTAWRRFLETVAAQRPLVLVFEDLHWADTALLDFVDHLVDWATGVPLLVICVARPELYERAAGWGGGKRNSTTISLPPLSEDDTARLVGALLEQAVLPAEIHAVMLERSGGNPLYAEEFVRMLTDRGILRRRGRLVELVPGAEIPVPESLQALIAARLDTLSTELKAALHDAAVVGKVFWAGAVAAIGERTIEAVRSGLHELTRKELVRPARTSSIEGDAEYSFWHVLVRDIAYGQIPRAARGRKHRAAADWIERIAGERVKDHAELLAHHYRRALSLARAAGAVGEADALAEPTRRFLTMAGDRACELDVARAGAYYDEALELLPAGHPARAEVLTKAAEAAWLSGRFGEAERGYDEAIVELREQGEPARVGDAMVSLSFVHGFRGETARSRELLAEVVELLEREPPGRELAHAYSLIARDRLLSGQSRECLEWSEKALAVAEELGAPGAAVMARQFKGSSLCELGDPRGIDDLRQALRTSLELGLGQETVRCHINLADWVWVDEGPAAGLEIQRAGIDFGERRGILGPAMWTKGESLWTLFDLGEWEELLHTAEELIAWDRAHGGAYFGVTALSYRAQVFVWRGRIDEASTLSEEFLPRARKIGDPQILAPALVTAGFVDLAKGDRTTALERIREFANTIPPKTFFWSNNLTDAVRTADAAGATDLGRRLVESTDEAFRRRRNSRLTAMAVLAEADGDFDEAARLFREAAGAWAAWPFPLEQGQALLGQARCLLALGRQHEARENLDEARKIVTRLGARPLVAETDSLLEQATALSS